MRRVDELAVGRDQRQTIDQRPMRQPPAKQRLHIPVGRHRVQIIDRSRSGALQALDRRGNRQSHRLQRSIDIFGEQIGKGLGAANAVIELVIAQIDEQRSAADQNAADHDSAGDKQRRLPPDQMKRLAKQERELRRNAASRPGEQPRRRSDATRRFKEAPMVRAAAQSGKRNVNELTVAPYSTANYSPGHWADVRLKVRRARRSIDRRLASARNSCRSRRGRAPSAPRQAQAGPPSA